MKRILCAILAALTVGLCLLGCSETGLEKVKYTVNESKLSGTAMLIKHNDELTLICENEKFALKYGGGSIYVSSKTDNTVVWKSAVDDTVYPQFSSSTETWKNYMTSIAAISYIAKSDTRGKFATDYSSSKANTVKAEAYQNGIAFTLSFKKPSIEIRLEITLDNDGISVNIPASGIKESGEYYLYSVELFPFLSSAPQNSEGYIFYPDGSGALSYFDKTDDKHKYTTALTLDVYGEIETDKHFDDNKNPIALLPVYGIKNSNNAFLAAVVEGDSDTQINVNTALSISAVKLNRASFSLIYRQKYSVQISDLSDKSAEGEKSSIRVDEKLLGYDRAVKYFLLENEDASYSGMANAYRDYLIKSGALDGKIDFKQNGLYLKLFMSAQENKGAFSNQVVTTDFEGAEEILKDYLDSGIDNITAILSGWQSGGYGYNASGYLPESSLGGKKGLKKLGRFTSKENIRLLLEIDNLNVTDKKGSFMKGKHTAASGSGAPVTDKTEKSFILSPLRVTRLFEKTKENTLKYENVELLYGGISELIYSDLSGSAPFDRYAVKKFFTDILKNAGAVKTGNLYSLKNADFVADTPADTSSAFIEDIKIPWYQMILHGSAVYLTDTGNSSYDLSLQKLKWIEYGAAPYFELTKENPSVLRDTDYTELFSSQSEVWKDNIVVIYNELAAVLKEFENSFITEHKYLNDNLVLIKYSNQKSIIINYSETDLQYIGHSVPQKGYKIIKE